MPAKMYLSEVFRPLSMARQQAILADGVPGWPEVAIFSDSGGKLDRLPNRGAMLHPTVWTQSDTIYVASLAVLASDENDFRTVVTQILAGDGVIFAVADKIKITKEIPLDVAVAMWKQVRKKLRISIAQATGQRASAKKRRDKAAIGVARIRPFWGLSDEEHSTENLLKIAGTETTPMAYNTVVAHIGYGREIARKRHQANLKRRTRKSFSLSEIASRLPLPSRDIVDA